MPRPPVPPHPTRRPTVLRAHGDERADDWYWMRERENPEVIAHLEAENAYTAAVTAPSEGARGALFEEIVGRIRETDLSVPVRKGPWLYYSRTLEGCQYPIHCRRPADTPADTEEEEEQVLLDENETAAGSEYFALGALAVSPDHRMLAYSTDTTGAERFTLRFRDLRDGRDLDEPVEDTYYGLTWSADSSTVFYTRPDAAMRPHQLWRHRVRRDPRGGEEPGGAGGDLCVHEERDERFYVGVSRTKDDRFVLLELESKVTSEVWALDASEPEESFRVVEPRSQGVEYSVSHHGERFLIVTNAEAENFRLVEAPEDSPGRSQWKDLVGHRLDVKLDGIDVFANHLVLYERAGASTRISVLRLSDGKAHTVEQPETVSTSWPGPNPEMGSGVLRYEYTSLVTPRSVFDYDLESRERVLLKRQPVLGGYEPASYRTERLWARADDGTNVPISLVHKDDTPRDGSAPGLLYGYGAYEHSVDPQFSPARLSLLDRGFVFAIAHVRGGGEMGRHWYEDGKLQSKPNTFTDFIACARHLVNEGWTSPDRLVARGASAGGLLMGAVVNSAPDLFRAVIAEVPFVDCLTTILDDSLPLTVLEWEEWGNPKDDADAYEWIKAYSPYDNVSDRRAPELLVTAALNDPRVGYWEPAKWVAKLRSANAQNRVLLKAEMGAGHRGPSGRYDAWRDEAFVLAFVLACVGMSG